jgi:TonB dependent receptor/Carboxypeptidase regulatory-like domain/TonB-dependent Receptor Plug Domain
MAVVRARLPTRRPGAKVLLPLALFVGATLTSADDSGGLAGVVSDSTQLVLPGVIVEVSGGSFRQQTTSGKDGHYKLDAIPAGVYRVSCQLPNFGIAVRDNVSVTAGKTTQANVTLFYATHTQVLVTGERPFRDLSAMNEPVNGMIGIADAASEGVVRADELNDRPITRPGDLLETVPGLAVSQHSGEGKANQYYLRGFNLDHGTDLATTIAGAPANMPTHAHGQGYSDINYLIPELVAGIQYKKGPYYADEGDFATAGAININYVDAMARPIVTLEGGDYGYRRGFAAGSTALGRGQLLGAFEYFHNDGPWANPDAYRKLNGVVRFTQGSSDQGFQLTAMGYDGRWNSTDQVPDRAIGSGLISRFGEIDPSDGGRSHRYMAGGEWHKRTGKSLFRAETYFINYSLDLFSNFTYFLDDPVHGDQFHQKDRRNVLGGKLRYQWFGKVGDKAIESEAGFETRYDDIGVVGLYHTEARQLLGTTRQDTVHQGSAALYYQGSLVVVPKARVVVGLRGDLYHFDVDSTIAENSGTATPGIVSPKLGLILGPWKDTEVYLNGGFGFHSNDGRGSTIKVDPSTLTPTPPVNPLVRAKGTEVGLRTRPFKALTTSLTLWALHLDSELVFSGDAGTTEPNRPSRRLGFEWAVEYRPMRWLAFDTDLAYSQARFTDTDPVGDRIPGAVEGVGLVDVLVDNLNGFFGSLNVRYFGPRPLIEDNSIRSHSATTVNLRLGHDVGRNLRIAADFLNLFDTKASDIDYYYASRLPGEPSEGVNDIHSHPLAPRSFHVGVSARF